MFTLLKICIEKIKDQVLLFAIFAILVISTFPEVRLYIFAIYFFAVIFYTIVTFKKLSKTRSDNKFLNNFKKFLENKKGWEKRIISNKEVYFYKNDNNYKIEKDNNYFKEWTVKESWMKKFPNFRVTEQKVYLKHGESKIAEISFLSCDGNRYFIPIPKKKCIKEDDSFYCLEFEYYWIKNSIEYKLGNIIGEFYREKDLERVARFCNIKIKIEE